MDRVAEKTGQILVGARLISEEQLEIALESQLESGLPLGQALLDLGFITEDELARTLAVQKGLQLIDLANYKIEPLAATSISEKIARRYSVVPVGFEDGHLLVAMANPLNVHAMDDIAVITGYPVEPMVATESDIAAAIDKLFMSDESVQEVVDVAAEAASDTEEEEQLSIGVEGAPVVKLTNRLILQALSQRASDIHIEPEQNRVQVRYRIDGVLQDATELPKRIQAAVISRIKIMSELDISERRIPQDGRTTLSIAGKDVDLRIATLPGIYGENVTIRILRKGQSMYSLAQLGMSKDNMRKYRINYTKPHGAILATGPTGCGKTTTLYGTLAEINTRDRKIITVEDPVEYEISGITQVQVNVRAGLTFANGLRAIVRNDPDIIMVGEIRDTETAEIAIRSALTGHLVLSTLHTNDAAGALTRMVDMGIAPFLITSSIRCVIAQRLVRRLCDECREPYPLSEALPGAAEDATVYRPKGCACCMGTGYKGRLGLFEMMVVSDQIARACLAGSSGDELERIALSQGMTSMFDDGIERVREGATSIEEVMRVLA